MNSSITHERCSELLGDFVAGELSSRERSLVDDHLAGCVECAAELDALLALAAPEVQPLTEGERAKLRAAVMGAATAAPGPSEVLADERDAVIVPLGGWRSKATRYVGIAAMLAILAVGFVYIGMLGTGGDDGEGAQGGGAENEVSQADSAGDSGGGAGEDSAERTAPTTGEALKDNQGRARSLSEQYFLTSEPGPVFEDDQGELSLVALDELSRRPVFRSFSEVYTVRQARRSVESSLAALAETVPGELAEKVRECGRTALGDLADPGLAAYATTGSVDGRDSLVIGFVTGTRSLDRYRFVTFQLGDCRTIVRSLGGYIS
ncbi:MAG: zf-HC2 domain-containing protein [Actinomycetota bacterium]